MPRRLITLPGFSGVAAGATATLNLPIGDTIYHSLRLMYGTSTASGADQTNTEAEVSEIRLKVNGKTQRVMSATELLAINAFHGRPFNTDATGAGASLPIFLGWPWARAAQGEDALAWGMADVDSFQIEVDIDSGASSPTLGAQAVIERGRRAMGPITKWRRYNEPVSATGIKTNTNLSMHDDYFAIYAFSSNIDDVEVKLDQEEVYRAPSEVENDFYHEDEFGLKVPQSGLFPVLFNPTARVADALKMRKADGSRRQELRVDWNMGSASGFDFITETVGLRD